MSYLFSTPTQDRTPPVLPETRGLQRRLFSHFHPVTQGMNMFKMPDGTYLLDLQPSHLSNPDPDRHEWDNVPVITYYGGHVYVVDDVEAEALSLAGYGRYLTPTDYGLGGYGIGIYGGAVA